MLETLKEEKQRYNDCQKTLCFRSRGNYKKGEDYKVSRSTLDFFSNCPCCSYLKEVIGLKNIPGPGWTLNDCVDTLSKIEMDRHRKNNTTPEILAKEGLKLFHHSDLPIWQDFRKGGISYYDPITKFNLYGAIDDLTINENGELVIIDVKSTSNKNDILTREDVFNNGETYKRQLEFYIWLFMKNGFKVSNKGYLLYYNGNKNVETFDKIMTFKETLVPIELDWSWVEWAIKDFYELLNSDTIPELNEKCDTCLYTKLRTSL